MIQEVIVLKKEVFDQVKRELIIIGILFLFVVIGLKLIFLSESFLVVFRVALSIFWLFILPGFALMFFWREHIKFHERLIIGIVVVTALTGLTSYYLGLIGLNIKYHVVVLPLILILIGAVINLRNHKI